MIKLIEKYKDNELTEYDIQVNRIIAGLNTDEFLDRDTDELLIPKSLIDAENLQEFCEDGIICDYLLEWNNDINIERVEMEDYDDENYFVYGIYN